MQRKATKNTRGPNAIEKAYHAWLKGQPCAYCNIPGPSIVDHARGATFKHNKVLIGHAFCTSKCEKCDSYKTQGSHKRHLEMTGKTESQAWIYQVIIFEIQTGKFFDFDIHRAIYDWAK